MAARRDDDLGTLGLLLAVAPWLLLPFAGFFLFFGDGPRDGRPDPRDAVLPWYLGITGLLALAGVVLGIARRKGRGGRMIATMVVGGLWVAIVAMLLGRTLLR